MSHFSELIEPLKEIVRQAGEAILEVYQSPAPIDVSSKSDDSPVTKADLAAHKIIVKGLEALGLNYPILSEEGGLPEFDTRKSWQCYWLVDPLDGTKEFINRNGEFTVNIALIDGGEAVLGMVYVPVTQTFYYGYKDDDGVRGNENNSQSGQSWKQTPQGETRLHVRTAAFSEKLSIVGSRRHGAEALERLLTRIEPQFSTCELVSMGSSLKICAIAEGSADWYPRLALTSEWDTAAAHAVLSYAGGKILDDDLQPLRYNQKDSLLNPFFHAIGRAEFDWPQLITESR